MTEAQRTSIKEWFENKKPFYNRRYYDLKSEYDSKILKYIFILVGIIAALIFLISESTEFAYSRGLQDGTLKLILICIAIVAAIYYYIPAYKLSSEISRIEHEYNRLNDLYLARISIKKLDELVEEDVAELQTKGMEELDLDKDELIADNVYVKSISDIKISEGQDLETMNNEVRFQIMSHNFFYFKEKKIAIYRVDFNHSTGEALANDTEEFFYQDIVSIKTATKSDKFMGIDCSQTYVQLNTSGDSRLRIFISSGDFIAKYRAMMIKKYEDNGEWENAYRLQEISENIHLETALNSKNTISAIRRMVDEKKS